MSRQPVRSIQAIQEQIRKLQAKAQQLKAKNKTPALLSIVKLMRENDISIEEVGAALKKGTAAGRAGRKAATAGPAKTGRVVPIKYRNPETLETWTGRGKTPRWIRQAETAGKNRSEFRV